VVLVTVGTGTDVGLKAIEVGLGLGFGLLVVAISIFFGCFANLSKPNKIYRDISHTYVDGKRSLSANQIT